MDNYNLVAHTDKDGTTYNTNDYDLQTMVFVPSESGVVSTTFNSGSSDINLTGGQFEINDSNRSI